MRRASKWKQGAVVALGLLASFPVAAQVPKAAPAAKPVGSASQSALPYDISADQQEMFNEERKTIYRGNVVVIQGTDRLNTPQLTLFFAKKDPNAKPAKVAATATATSTFGKMERMEAEGPVYVTTPTQNAKGDHGTYIAADDTTTLTGNVVLVQDKNVSTGDKLIIHKTDNHATLFSKSGAPQRVRGVFYQDDAAKAPGSPGAATPATAKPGLAHP